MKHILIMVSMVIGLSAVTAQVSISQQEKIDALFSKWDHTDSPGGSVGIIKDGVLIYAKGYGMANLEHDIPNQPTSVFRIGSTSKQFTAACILLLQQEGKLSLGDNLRKFFPKFPAYATKITLQHLLNHTSGIRDYLILARLAGLSSNDFYTDQQVEKWLTNQQGLNFNPGDQYLYSNSGYWLLGQIVQKLSGKSMAAYAKEHIFTPLKMKETHFHDNHKELVKNRASGYRPKRKGGFAISMSTLDMIGDGGVFTTVKDLAKWDAAFYNTTVFSKEFWKGMTTVGKLNNGENINYAAGLSVSNYKGLMNTQHSGSFVGFKAEMIRFAEQQFTVIILTNRADANPTSMAYKLVDLFLANELAQQVTKPQSTNIKKAQVKSIVLTRKELAKFEGAYWSTQNTSSRTLAIRNDTLHYVRANGRATPMKPIAKNKFQMIGPRVPVILEVQVTKISKMFILKTPNTPALKFNAYTPITSFSASDLVSYAGTYYSEELEVIYTLTVKKNQLVLFVKGNPVGAITPVMKNLLSLHARQTFAFTRARDGFSLSMLGRVKNVKFVKQ